MIHNEPHNRFVVKQSGDIGYEIVDLHEDGKVYFWVIGEDKAQILVQLLNLADRYNVFEERKE